MKENKVKIAMFAVPRLTMMSSMITNILISVIDGMQIALEYSNFNQNPVWSLSYNSWNYIYLCNLCLSPLKL